MKKTVRNYKIEDAKLIEHSEKVKGALVIHITDFMAFDSTLDATYPEILDVAIVAATTHSSDEVVVGQQAALTENVNAVMGLCNKAFKTIAFFVRIAFPTQLAVQKQFGLTTIDQARHNQAKMVLFMDRLNTVAQQYATELTTAGCSPVVIESLAGLATQLKEANALQENFKGERPVITVERVEKLNALYQLALHLSNIAHIIYADEPTKLAIFAMTRPASSTDSPDDLIVS